MSAYGRLGACPMSKMIAASHAWQGYGPFSFPGFKGTFSGQTWGSWNGTYYPDSGGSWSGGGGVPSLGVGDLVLSAIPGAFGSTGCYVYTLTTALPSGWPSVDPQIDSVGSAIPFPNLIPGGASWSGSGPWSYTVTGLIVGLQYVFKSSIGGGPYFSLNGTASNDLVFTAAATTATITTSGYLGFEAFGETPPVANTCSVQLDPAPAHFTLWDYQMISPDTLNSESGPTLYPLIDVGSNLNREVWGQGLAPGLAYLTLTITDDFSGLSGASGAPGTDTVLRTWTVNKYSGAVTTGGPTPTPSSGENAWLFPALPSAGSGPIAQILISLTTTGASIVFEFGYTAGGMLYSFTQTLALTSEYDLATAFTDTTTLLNANAGSQAAEFAALSWGQEATCTYNSDGSVHVVVSTMGTTVNEGTGCASGAPGGSNATAAAGYGYIALVDGADIAMSTALVDVCGAYCLRAYHCTAATPVVDCASGTVDGYAPVTIAVPSLPSGETHVWAYLFPNCQCT